MNYEDYEFADLQRRCRETAERSAALLAKYAPRVEPAKPQSSLADFLKGQPIDPFEQEVRGRVREARRKEEQKAEARRAVYNGYAQIERERAEATANEERDEARRRDWRMAARRKYPHRFNFREEITDDE